MDVRSLIAENLTCIRGGRLIFRDVSLRVDAGQVLALEGANGAGKTSLLRMIAGFLAPASGTITLKTSPAQIDESEERGKHVGWLGHADAVKPQMTPRETLRFFADVYRTGDNVEAALDEVGLTRARDLPTQYLSAGQKKRLALARLKLCGRLLWLLDEPAAALDADGKILAAKFIRDHCASGGIAIAATHEPLDLTVKRLFLG
ncbi:MAG TPA: heme ABC exporter ATP-binding protein CcmA [Rhizomicrobium sp.]|jgi:heme exporter protein A|nr:heme ABC exporter ATP-binding protein CcmA [Rhizomicrobium sp.]